MNDEIAEEIRKEIKAMRDTLEELIDTLRAK